MKVTKLDDVKVGLEKLGLEFDHQPTKLKEWTRLHVHMPQGVDIHGKTRPTLYICRISFHHNMVNSYKMFGLPDFYAHAIKLMLMEGKILNHINYHALRVKALNATLHLKEEAEAIALEFKGKNTKKGKEAHKAMLKFHWEKQKLFTALFRERYYGISAEPQAV